MLSYVRIGVLAVVLSLAAARKRSDAQFFFPNRGLGFGGWPSFYNSPYYGGYYPSTYIYAPYYSPPTYYPTISYSNPRVIYVAPLATSTTPVEPGKPAKIEVKLPAKAELWFDGKQTTQTGTVRHFVTPPLFAVVLNAYEVKATWTDETGALVIRTRRIEVLPGESVVVDLNAADG